MAFTQPKLPVLPERPTSPVAADAATQARPDAPINFGTKSLVSTGSITGLATKAKTSKRTLIGGSA